MSPAFAVFILMNNYFHDVATAMLLACGIALWVIIKQREGIKDPVAADYFLKLARGINGVAKFSLAWIILAGIPRVLTFKSFEWPNAVEKHHEAGLIAKYAIAVAMMIVGAWLWAKLSKRIREIKSSV